MKDRETRREKLRKAMRTAAGNCKAPRQVGYQDISVRLDQLVGTHPRHA